MKQIEFTTTHALVVLVMLLFFTFLYQPSVYENMIHTFLGRLTLLFILILLTSCNSMFGLAWAIVIIYFYEYYSRFEGLEIMDPSIINVSQYQNTSATSAISSDAIPIPNPVPDDFGINSTPEPIPDKALLIQAKNSSTIEQAMDQAAKLEKERRIQKGNSSSSLPVSMPSSMNVSMPSSMDVSMPSSISALIPASMITSTPASMDPSTLSSNISSTTSSTLASTPVPTSMSMVASNPISMPVSTPISMSTSTSSVLPSESTTTSYLASKQGFANMFGGGYTNF